MSRVRKITKKIVNVDLVLLSLVVLAIGLRIYKLDELFGFGSELGDNLLDVKNAIESRTIPLLGPPTSHPWLYFGPIYFWLLIPPLVIFSFNPLVITYLGAISGVVGVYLNYKVIKTLFDKKVAIISTYLLSISWFYVSFARSGRFMFWVSVLLYALMFFVYQVWRKKTKYMFWAGLTFGVMLNFHLTTFVLAPTVVIMFLIKRRQLKRQDWVMLGIGFLLPQIPFIIYDAANKFQMTSKFILWIPYRALGFLGIIEKNQLTADTAGSTIENILSYFYLVIGQENVILGFLFATLVIVYLLIKMREKTFGWIFIGLGMLFGIIAFFVHTNPPIHYFVPILPFPIIIFSSFLAAYLSKGKKEFAFVALVLLALTFFNIKDFAREYYSNEGGKILDYDTRKKIANSIIEDSENKDYLLSRVGLVDDFESDSAQSYQYLLWLMGNEPVVVGDTVVDGSVDPELEYTIYEDGGDISEDQVVLIEYGDVVVTRKEL